MSSVQSDKYLALDISLNSTGYCVMTSAKELVCFGVFDVGKIKGTSKEDTQHEKIEEQIRKLNDLIQNHGPKEAFIERFSFGSFKFSNAASALGEVTGCLKQEIWSYDIPYLTLAPTSVKKFVTGSGRATKEEVYDSVVALYPEVKGQKNDVTDAIAVCLMGISLRETSE